MFVVLIDMIDMLLILVKERDDAVRTSESVLSPLCVVWHLRVGKGAGIRTCSILLDLLDQAIVCMMFSFFFR